jgi:hypothetical protein
VRTEPTGARVFVDGVEKGVSPLFIEGLASGTAEIVAEVGNFRGQASVEVQEDKISTVFLSLGQRFGALKVRTTLSKVMVYLDETSSYSPDSPALGRITPGQYLVLLEGVRKNGQLVVSERPSEIRPDETTVLDFE